MLSLRINGKMYSVDVEPETPLLWVIRDTIGLTGTKGPRKNKFTSLSPIIPTNRMGF